MENETITLADIRWLLENFGSAFYACGTESQRQRVAAHALTALSTRTKNIESK